MQNRKNIILHLLCAGILLAGFLLCRYLLFDLHGMKYWPELLFKAGLFLLLISFVVKAKIFPCFAALAYPVGFLAGLIFRTDGVDPGGGRTNNLWIIWTLTMIGITAAGVLYEWLAGRKSGS